MERECVIIPIKEYEALKNKIKKLEEDNTPEIKIEWGYSHERYDYYYSNQGKFLLSEGLYSQIRRICALINNDMKAKMDEREVKLSKTHERIEANIKEDTLFRVSLLPWYKRLWFKPEYVK